MQKETTKSALVMIVLANILSQGLLLFVTGTFWDDWHYYYHNRVGLWRAFMESGRPSQAYWIEAVWNIPHNGYRWLVFLLFLLTGILLYLILRNCDMFSSEEALWLSVLYTVIPVNDARIILCTFSYGVGLTSFFFACYVFSKYIKTETPKKFLLRMVSLIFFCYSFTIQSILMYYAVILCYLLYFEYKNKGRLLNAIRAMLGYLDFIMLPIVFFIGKQCLFPPYGPRFTGYNSVTWKSVLQSALRLPIAVIRQLQRNWISIFDFMATAKIIQFLTILFVIFAVAHNAIRFCNSKGVNFRENIGGLRHPIYGNYCWAFLYLQWVYIRIM